MKKNLFILLVSSAFSGFAQDTIYKTDGSKHIGKVTEINSSSVKYILSGTEVSVETNKTDIRQINYKNGTRELYNNSVPVMSSAPPKQEETYYTNERYTAPVKKTQMVDYGRNIIALNLFEMFFTNIGFSYERILGNGTFGIKVPFSFGLGGKPNENNYRSDYWTTIPLQNKNFGTGLEFNIYPLKQHRSTFYLGISATYTDFKYFKDTVNSYVYVKTAYTGTQYSGLIHIGGYLGLTDNLLMGGKIGIGFRREETIDIDYTLPRIQMDLNLAYRF